MYNYYKISNKENGGNTWQIGTVSHSTGRLGPLQRASTTNFAACSIKEAKKQKAIILIVCRQDTYVDTYLQATQNLVAQNDTKILLNITALSMITGTATVLKLSLAWPEGSATLDFRRRDTESFRILA